MEPFYYNHMNKNQQAAYRAMQQGLTNLSDEFQIPRLEGKDLSNVFFELRLDHPEIFWASGFKYKYYPDSPNLILIPEYLFDKGKIREHQKAMGARIEKLARPAMKLTELEKERYIHDFICEHVHYDKLKKPYSHEIIGPLGQGVGVCEGIAKSVKILCDTLGIWCMIALCGNNPEKGNPAIPGTSSRSGKRTTIWTLPSTTVSANAARPARKSATITSISTTRRSSATTNRSSPRRPPARTATISIIKKRSSPLPNRRTFTSAPYRRQKKEKH